MSTYKEIRGLKVRDYTTNPDNPIEGQLWYNETDNVAKYQIPNIIRIKHKYFLVSPNFSFDILQIASFVKTKFRKSNYRRNTAKRCLITS